jgi:CheY-like chemotaxis protein
MSSSSLCAAFLPSPAVICLAAEPDDRARVLVVDDDPDSRVALDGWLDCKGYAVAQAAGPAEADELLARTKFDAVISDIHMPGNERLQWAEQLLQRPGAPAVVLLTGNPEFETACRAANLAVAGYLVKPPDFNVVEALLRRVVAEQRQRAEFLQVSKEILSLLGAHGANGLVHERVLVERLAGLAHCFAGRMARAEAGPAGMPPGDEPWRAAIGETIAVIEKTKDSFRSKELGQLRLRLQRMLAGRQSAGGLAAECVAVRSKRDRLIRSSAGWEG